LAETSRQWEEFREWVWRNANAEPVAKLVVDALARQPDGRILFGGQLQQAGGLARTNVYRLHSDGTLDATFQASPGHPLTIRALTVLPDNRVLLGGTFNYTNAYFQMSSAENFRDLVRLTTEGKLDPTFRPHVNANQVGQISFDYGIVCGMAAVGSEKVLVAGKFERPESGFTRLNADGSRDETFNPRVYAQTDEIGRGGVPSITAMALDKTGDSAIAGGFLVAGGEAQLFVATLFARFTEKGYRTGLSPNVSNAQALTFQQDGKVIVGGLVRGLGPVTNVIRTNIARLDRNGSLDVSFGRVGGGPNDTVTAIVVEPSGSILIGGWFTTVDGVTRRGIARLYGSGKIYRELLHPRVQESQFSASIQTLAGKRYTVERSDLIASSVWSVVATLDGDGSLKSISDPAPGLSQRYYRLRVE
jgi:uncharacterized delta-60 repeat protein